MRLFCLLLCWVGLATCGYILRETYEWARVALASKSPAGRR